MSIKYFISAGWKARTLVYRGQLAKLRSGTWSLGSTKLDLASWFTLPVGLCTPRNTCRNTYREIGGGVVRKKWPDAGGQTHQAPPPPEAVRAWRVLSSWNVPAGCLRGWQHTQPSVTSLLPLWPPSSGPCFRPAPGGSLHPGTRLQVVNSSILLLSWVTYVALLVWVTLWRSVLTAITTHLFSSIQLFSS